MKHLLWDGGSNNFNHSRVLNHFVYDSDTYMIQTLYRRITHSKIPHFYPHQLGSGLGAFKTGKTWCLSTNLVHSINPTYQIMRRFHFFKTMVVLRILKKWFLFLKMHRSQHNLYPMSSMLRTLTIGFRAFFIVELCWCTRLKMERERREREREKIDLTNV